MRKNKENVMKEIDVTYYKLFTLFIIGSLAGFLLEGMFSFFKRGAWESHVVSVWGPFCIIYGIGFAACYAGYARIKEKNRFYQFMAFGIGGCIIELLCGMVLDYGIHMRAWNYSKHLFNFHGYVSPDMIIVWGTAGILFTMAIPFIEKVFDKIYGNSFKSLCLIASAFMAINLGVTSAAIIRWSERHFNIPVVNVIEEKIDEIYPDNYMEKRFCEWKFTE